MGTHVAATAIAHELEMHIMHEQVLTFLHKADLLIMALTYSVLWNVSVLMPNLVVSDNSYI